MTTDKVDNLLIQWAEERPDLESGGLGIVVRINRLAALLSDGASRALRRKRLALWEYDVLSALRRQGAPFRLSASDLAAETCLSSGAMTNRIDRLEKKQLVRRVADQHDRRGVKISLTERGRELIALAVHARVEAADKSLGALNARERQTLERLLRKLLVSEEPIT